LAGKEKARVTPAGGGAARRPMSYRIAGRNAAAFRELRGRTDRSRRRDLRIDTEA